MPVTNNTSSMPHPRRRNVTTSMAGPKNGYIRKNVTHQKMVNPRDKAGKQEEEESANSFSLWLHIV